MHSNGWFFINYFFIYSIIYKTKAKSHSNRNINTFFCHNNLICRCLSYVFNQSKARFLSAKLYFSTKRSQCSLCFQTKQRILWGFLCFTRKQQNQRTLLFIYTAVLYILLFSFKATKHGTKTSLFKKKTKRFPLFPFLFEQQKNKLLCSFLSFQPEVIENQKSNKKT